MMKSKRKPSVFLDRDGTVIKDKHYLSDPNEIELFDFSFEALRILQELGFHLFIITNQSGVARGLLSEVDVIHVNECLDATLREAGIVISAFYYCPYHKDGLVEKYRKDSNCRKPKTGMIDMALNEFDIERNRSYVIGDKLSDVELGINAKMNSIMLLTGHGVEELNTYEGEIHFPVCKNILDAAQLIKTEMRSR